MSSPESFEPIPGLDEPTVRRRRQHRSRNAGFGRVARLAVVATLAAFLTAMQAPASASPTQGVKPSAFAEHVDMAGAAWVAESDHSSTVLEVRVFHLAQRTTSSGMMRYKDPGVVLFYTHREIDPETGIRTETNYEGFSGGSGATFDFDRSLGGAEATFPLTLWGYRCTYPPGSGEPQDAEPTCEDLDDAEVTAQMSWTGVGDIVRNTNSDRYKDTPFVLFGAHTVFAVRDAEATATIAGDGVTLADGPATFAVLLRGKYHEQLVQPPVRP